MKTEKGFTLVELMVALTVFCVFVIQLSSVWTSLIYHMKYMTDRTMLQWEVRTARTYLASDMAGATSATVPSAGVLLLQYPSTQVTYSISGANLVRADSAAAWSMPVAQYLQGADYTLDPTTGNVLANLTFQRGVSQVTCNVYLSFAQS